jgi:uncharacterized lipoprotein YajG
VRKTLVLIAMIAVLAACRGKHGAQTSTQTDTITPVAPKPAPVSDTEAMTQTVDVEDSRTDAEGGVLTKSDTATAVKKKTGAAAAGRKQPTSQSRPPGRTQ